MTKEAALFRFFSGFGIDAYPSSDVKPGTEFPYLTYSVQTDNFFGGPVGLTVQLWYYAQTETAPNAKAREISKAIGDSGVVTPVDGGYIWIKRGNPWCTNSQAEGDPNVKVRQLNVTVEYLTKD